VPTERPSEIPASLHNSGLHGAFSDAPEMGFRHIYGPGRLKARARRRPPAERYRYRDAAAVYTLSRGKQSPWDPRALTSAGARSIRRGAGLVRGGYGLGTMGVASEEFRAPLVLSIQLGPREHLHRSDGACHIVNRYSARRGCAGLPVGSVPDVFLTTRGTSQAEDELAAMTDVFKRTCYRRIAYRSKVQDEWALERQEAKQRRWLPWGHV
jgi:hypothetical protein